MRLLTLLAAAVLVVLVQAGAATARDQLNQKDVVVVQPHKSYIFYRTAHRRDLRFLREVTPAQRTAWQAARAAALAEQQTAYPRRLLQWQRLENDCRGSVAPACTQRDPRPIQPTEQNFAYAAPELENFITVGSGPQFTRASGANSYLIAVEPGTYILYGQFAVGSNGEVGICLCMGSVKFEARAGQIVDLGEIRYPRIDAVQPRPTFGPGRVAAIEVVPSSPAMPLPDRLAGKPVVPATLRAADKLPNFFGVEIDRHPAIPGVLGYERDRVMDLVAGRPAD